MRRIFIPSWNGLVVTVLVVSTYGKLRKYTEFIESSKKIIFTNLGIQYRARQEITFSYCPMLKMPALREQRASI